MEVWLAACLYTQPYAGRERNGVLYVCVGVILTFSEGGKDAEITEETSLL